jgi:LysR family hydrogen peroxide-inducible transcriptional activator
MQAATLETLVNLVAAGYGTTLIPALAADSLSRRGIALRPLAGQSARTIRLVSRMEFPRPQALRTLERVIRKAVALAIPRVEPPPPRPAAPQRGKTLEKLQSAHA